MSERKFSYIEPSLQRGWQLFKQHAGFLIGVQIVCWLISVAIGQLQFFFTRNSALYFIMQIISYFAVSWLAVGLIKIGIELFDGRNPELKQLFLYGKLAPSMFLSQIAYSIIVLAGLLLLVVPGLMWATQFGFYSFIISDQGAGPVEAFKTSARLTQGSRWRVFALLCVILLLNILGACLLFVGLLVTLPISMFALIYVYRDLQVKQAV